MGFSVLVQVKDKRDIYGPELGTREEAEGEITKIRRTIGTSNVPELAWLAISGENIVSAQIIERTPSDVQPWIDR